MPGRLTRLVRTVVLRTNPYWPFRLCNRIPYRAAIRLFVRSFQRWPEIRSIYLRHGLVEGEWIPALSDIDFTLILQRNLPVEAEYEFLETFWKRYVRLRRIFPMLGEVEILGEDEFAAWLALSSCAPTGRRWRLLHGEDNGNLSADGSPHWRRHALCIALWVYLEILPDCLSAPDSFLRRHDIRRRARKILRLLQPILAEAGEPQLPEESTSDPAEMLTDVLVAFRGAVAQVTSREPPDGIVEPPEPRPAAPESCEFLPDPITGAEGIRSVVLRWDQTALFLMEDGLERRRIRGLVEKCLQGWPGLWETPILMHRCQFAYLVRHANPFYYSKLLRHRTVAFGEDPLAGIDTPSVEALAGHTLDQIANVLTFPRREELLSAAKPLRLSALVTSLNRALTAKLLFRGEDLSPVAEENALRGRSAFPESVRAFEEIEGQLAEGREEAARRAAFCLFRSLASDIAYQISRLGGEEKHTDAAGGQIGD